MATKINSFRSNYMARRGQVYGILQTCPSFGRCLYFNPDTGKYCAVGWLAKHLLNLSDKELVEADQNNGNSLVLLYRVANVTGLRFETILSLQRLSDHGGKGALPLLRRYLLNKKGVEEVIRSR